MKNKINIASRGRGTVSEDGTIKDYELISFDIVSPPGFKNAKMKQRNWFQRTWKRFVSWLNKIRRNFLV